MASCIAHPSALQILPATGKGKILIIILHSTRGVRIRRRRVKNGVRASTPRHSSSSLSFCACSAWVACAASSLSSTRREACYCCRVHTEHNLSSCTLSVVGR